MSTRSAPPALRVRAKLAVSAVMEAGGHFFAGQRFFFFEAGADLAEDGHIAVGPQNAPFAFGG